MESKRRASDESKLNIIDPPQKQRGRTKPFAVHLIRLLVFVSILLAIRYQHQKFLALDSARRLAPELDLSLIQSAIPEAAKIQPWNSEGAAEVVNRDGAAIATLFHTAKESREIVGYVGSTYLLIILNDKAKVQNVLVLESEDTKEHLKAIIDDPNFLNQWNGLGWKEAAASEGVDAVSGATLTSLAIIQSIRTRLGNPQPSLKFPNATSLGEVKSVWKDAATFQPVKGHESWFEVKDSQDQTLGLFLRSSPVADSIHGYQGPTDLLAYFDSQLRFERMVIRSSFDNMEPEPFVEYVKEEEYFLVDQFAGKSLEELAGMDLDEVEGVSGATMTSQGVFRSLQFTAAQILRDKQNEDSPSKSSAAMIEFGWRDLGTLLVLLTAAAVTFTRLKHSKNFRRVFQWTLVIYLGLINGDMIAQTLMVGWAKTGIGWENAFGLAVLTVAALLIPILTKQNIYCQSICPYGAAQHLSGRIIKKKPKIPPGIIRVGRWIPSLLICLVVASIALRWNLNLASIEPFDAFSFQVAGWASISIALVGLLVSIFVPMAYCRFGCPTGAVLNYLRRNARSDRIGSGDWLAILILAVFIFRVI